MKKIAVVLTLAVAFCFTVVLIAEATDTTAGRTWARRNLKNKYRVTAIPIWQITQEGKDLSVTWVDATNKRFAIYDPLGDNDPTDPDTFLDDLVLDKETGLVWSRNADIAGQVEWAVAVYQAGNLELANRKGFRLPTREELSTLIDLSGPADRPDFPFAKGHPFVKVQHGGDYWTISTSEVDSSWAWSVQGSSGVSGRMDKRTPFFVWPVRGGNGYATGNW